MVGFVRGCFLIMIRFFKKKKNGEKLYIFRDVFLAVGAVAEAVAVAGYRAGWDV